MILFFGLYQVVRKNVGEVAVTIQRSNIAWEHCIALTQSAVDELLEALKARCGERCSLDFQSWIILLLHLPLDARQTLQAGLALLIWREVLAESKSWFLNQFFFLDCSRVWSITPNPILNFHRTTHQVMDVTIGHTYSMQHDFKPNTSREMESGKCRKYWRFYQQQRLAFAPIVT